MDHSTVSERRHLHRVTQQKPNVVEMKCHSFIEVYCAAKSCIQSNFEDFHVTFALFNNPGQFCDFPVNLRLIAFQVFHCAVMWKVKEGLANLVAINRNQMTRSRFRKCVRTYRTGWSSSASSSSIARSSRASFSCCTSNFDVRAA